MTTEFPSEHVVTIRPARGWVSVNLRELWAYRELLYFLVWRNVKVRYKQAVLGIVWVVVQPLATSLLFVIIFSGVVGISVVGVPYLLFVYAGLLPWNLFAKGLTEGGTSVAGGANLVTKVFFPRLVLPASVVLSGSIDFAVGFAVLAGLIAYYGVAPTLALLSLPFFMLLALLFTLGVAFFFSAVDVRYRDVQATLPFLSVFLFLATPIFYPTTLVSPMWHWLYALNPMLAVVEGFRWALLGLPWTLEPHFIALSISAGVGFFLLGLFYFRRVESMVADLV